MATQRNLGPTFGGRLLGDGSAIKICSKIHSAIAIGRYLLGFRFHPRLDFDSYSQRHFGWRPLE